MTLIGYYALVWTHLFAGYPDPIDRTIFRMFAKDYCFAWNEL